MPDVLPRRWAQLTRVLLIFIALVHATGRVLIVLSALEAIDGRFHAAAVIAFAATVAMTATRITTTFNRAQLELGIARNAIAGILQGDPFEPGRTHYETLLVGVFDDARLRGEVFPLVLGDVVASVVVLRIAIAKGVGSTTATFLGGLVCGVAVVAALQRRLARASQRAWAARERYGRLVLDALDGMQEVMTTLPKGAYEARIESGLRERGRLAWLLGIESLVAGRVPLIVGSAAAALFAITLTRDRILGDWLIFGSTLPPFVGLAGALATYIQSRAPVRAVRELVVRRPRSRGDRDPSSPKTIVCEAVCVDIGGRLRNVNGEWSRPFVVTGPNGSGKSTFLKLLAGLATPSTGILRIGGEDSTTIDWDRFRPRIAYLPQRPYFPMGATARDVIRFLHGEIGDREIRKAMEQSGAWNVLVAKSPNAPLDVSVDTLSIGERQRVAIARVIVREAELYLLDEPDANLDPEGLARLLAILAKLSSEANVVVAAHTASLVDAFETRVALREGRVA